ncbi:hypothetical protein OSTOST_02841, partial [Ostertagia ostertagi]
MYRTLCRTVTKEEWNEETYPPHCAGLVYFTSLAVVKRLLSSANSQRFFWIDDVFITGVLAKAVNVTIDDLSKKIAITSRVPQEPKWKEDFFLTEKKYSSYWFHVINYNLQ